MPLLRGGGGGDTAAVRSRQHGRASRPPVPAPYLQEEEFEGVRLLQPRDLQLRLVGAALALHLGAPRQRDVGLLRDQLRAGSGAERGEPGRPPYNPLGRPTTRSAAPQPGRRGQSAPLQPPRPHSHPRSCWPTRRKGRGTWRRIPPSGTSSCFPARRKCPFRG